MATQVQSQRFALRPIPDRQRPDGAWWPENRSLSDQLGHLFAAWPPAAGRINRVLYSPPDWDDHPHSVKVPGRVVKTGSFPHDDTHQIVLSMGDGARRYITVLAPATPEKEAEQVLAGVTDAAPTTAG